MAILHQVVREVVRVVRNATRQLALAYQNARPVFIEHQAYFKPYLDAFTVIGLADELENDYFYHAEIPLEESIPENIAPLQAAAIFSRLFNQESFFMLHEYSLLAFVQLAETSNIIEKSNVENKSALNAQLGSVNWVTRFELLAKELADIIAKEVSAEEKSALIAIQDFIAQFGIVSMQYLDSLAAFQKHVVAGTVTGDSERSINQVLLELNAKQTELNICRRKLETITNNLNGFWAEFYSLDANLPMELEWLTKKISLLERDEIPLLLRQLRQEHQNILSDLQKYRGVLNNLRKTIENLDIDIGRRLEETEPPEQSSTLAWKRAILEGNAEYLKKLLDFGLDPQVISNYLSINNKAATLQQDQISAVLIQTSLLFFQQQPAEAVASSSASHDTSKSQAVVETPKPKMLAPVKEEVPVASPLALSKIKKTQAAPLYKTDSLNECHKKGLASGQIKFFAEQLPLGQLPVGAPKKVTAKTTAVAAAKKAPTNH